MWSVLVMELCGLSFEVLLVVGSGGVSLNTLNAKDGSVTSEKLGDVRTREAKC